MKTAIIFLCVFVSGAFAQSSAFLPAAKVERYIPKTLFAGTSMSGRTVSSSYDDTTQGFQTGAFARVYVGLETLANDSVRLLVSYQTSKDGQTYDALVLFDSLSSTTPVGKAKYFELPAGAMGAYSVRVRVYGNTDLLRYSDSPSATVTTYIVRKPQ